jgi:hypothetical protein
MRIAVTGSDDSADAMKWTGDPETEAGNGDVTVMPAHEAAARARIAPVIRIACFIVLNSVSSIVRIRKKQQITEVSGAVSLGVAFRNKL